MLQVTDQIILFSVFAPFLAAVAAPLLLRFMGQAGALFVSIVPLSVFISLLTLVGSVASGQEFVTQLSWVPQLGVSLSFYVDGLSLVFALLISGIGTLIVIYAAGYLRGHPHLGRFQAFLFLFMGAMLGVVLCDDFIALFIFWELTSITSFLLIGFDHTRSASRRAALQALIVTGGGGLALLAGLLIIGQVTGASSLSELRMMGDILIDAPAYGLILLLILGGAFTKSAQFPFHFWLPNAMEAPTPVSAYLHSATMVKAGVYLLMRLQPSLGGSELWTTILPLFGMVTLLVGGVLAIRQTDLKLMLAYTTVASLGLLVMLTGTSVDMAIQGAVIYLFAHSLFKGALFMVAGVIDHGTGTRDITRLGGLAGPMPLTFAAACLAGLSMAGLPPFIGFVGKEVLYDGLGLFDRTKALFITGAVIGNGLMLAVAAAIVLRSFFGTRTDTPKPAHEGSIPLILGPLLLAISGLIFAIFLHSSAVYLLYPMTGAILGYPFIADLHLLPVKINAPLILSIITVTLGLVIYWQLDRLRATVARLLTAFGWGPDKGFDQCISGLLRFSLWQVPRVQSGKMSHYMCAVFVALALTLTLSIFAGDALPEMPALPDLRFYEWGIMAVAIIGLVAVLVARSRLTAIASLGIQGFAAAIIFLLFGAPDLAFTQFMVETLAVVILALVMTRLNLEARDRRSQGRRIRDAIIALICGIGVAAVLLRITQSRFDTALSDFFAEFSRSIAHGRNIVNVIIVDFRGFDTLGEIAVVMIAGLCVLALIGIRARPSGGDKRKLGAE